MRTPPPVLPTGEEDSPDYQRSWMDRVGADAPLQLRAASYGAMVGVMLFAGALLAISAGGKVSGAALLTALVIATIVGVLVATMASRLAGGAGAVAKAFTMPSGNSTPYEQQFSYQESMAARGDMAGALESYEAIIAEQPSAVAPRMRAAEHYAKGNRDAKRAAELFREIRDTVGVPTRDAVYASSRLVDLYDGPLADPGRALVEMRRIIEQYPASRLAEHARDALPALKARLHGPQPD
jgi:hypothetical protein